MLHRCVCFYNDFAVYFRYGSSFAGVVDGVRQLAVLCDKVGRGDLDIQTISSLDDYLKQQVNYIHHNLFITLFFRSKKIYMLAIQQN